VNGQGFAGLEAAAERRLVRPVGSTRHVDFVVRASSGGAPETRAPLSLALVIDRSGSMRGTKMETARSAALMVLDRLDERDTASVTVFDDHVDVVLPAGRADAAHKSLARSRLAEVEARAQTALHEGWLSGCRTIASDEPAGGGAGSAAAFCSPTAWPTSA
jgi:Ca-activated chloride channel homolog